MAFLPMAWFLLQDALSLEVDFRAGKSRCLTMCLKGCGDDPSDTASSCVPIAEESAAPWVDLAVTASQDVFTFKWCQTKYEISIVATQSNGGLFQTIKYPRTGLHSDTFAEVDHLDWLAPACNRTTTPSCTSVDTMQYLPDGFWRWFAHEGEKCRNLADAQTCIEDCSRECNTWCECGWGESAVEAYEAGLMRIYRRQASGVKRTCSVAFTFNKECTCAHGIAAEGNQCSFHGREQCVACSSGYTLHNAGNANATCKANVCECKHGVPVDTAECLKHETTKCKQGSCDAAFHFESDDCKANICECHHGAPVDTADCFEHGATKCRQGSCAAAFHFEADRCKANVCECEHGAPVDTAECLKHGRTKCKQGSCDAAFHFESDDCKANICECHHGAPVDTTDCFEHGATKCRQGSCAAAFHFEADRCKANVCECEYGAPVDTADCFEHGATKCRQGSCAATFRFEADRCKANVCKCDHGAPVGLSECFEHGATKCMQSGCDVKFRFDAGKCKVDCGNSDLGEACAACFGFGETTGCVARGRQGVCSSRNNEWKCSVGCEDSHLGDACPACIGNAHVGCVASGRRGICGTNHNDTWKCLKIDCEHIHLGEVCHACVGHANDNCIASGQWGTCSNTREEWKCIGVKLVSGTSVANGNVYVDGLPVCDDDWDHNAAQVVCRMLGYPSGVHLNRSHFGYVSSVFSLNNVKCSGREIDIRDCQHKSDDECTGYKGAGVHCFTTCLSVQHKCLSPMVDDDTKAGNACASVLCNDTECCKVTCASRGHTCAGSLVRDETKEDWACASAECSDAECCGATCASSGHECDRPWIRDASKHDHVCATGECSDVECCAIVCEGSSLGDVCASCVGHENLNCVASRQRGTCSTDESDAWYCSAGVKLVGGNAPSKGNVFVNGLPVCDDLWGAADARVVCNMLGYPFGRPFGASAFGNVGAEFSMDDVQCVGNETHIKDCKHSQRDNCGGGEGAGVECSTTSCHSTNHHCTAPLLDVDASKKDYACASAECSDAECCMATCAAVGHVCNSQLIRDESKHNHVCAKLECSDAECCMTTCASSGHVCDSPKIRDASKHDHVCATRECSDEECCAVSCEGSSLGDICAPCSWYENLDCVTSGQRGTCSTNESDAWYCSVGVKLVGGSAPSKGNVFVNGLPVCDHYWDAADAKVVCNMLGYPFGRPFGGSAFGNVGDEFSMDDVQCVGNETHIKDCKHLQRDNCGGGDGAGVECSTTSCHSTNHRCTAPLLDVDASKKDYACASAECSDAECCMATCAAIRHVCNSQLIRDKSKHNHVCAKLECSDAECCMMTCASSGHVCDSPKIRDASKHNHECTTEECSDVECCATVCEGSSLGDVCAPCVGHENMDCVASGQRGACSTDESDAWYCSVGVKLVGGNAPFKGNVFVSGLPVCDDLWGAADARVVCNMLGYPFGRPFGGSAFGNVGAEFSMDDVQCMGNETHIKDCKHSQRDNCGGGEGAGVECSTT